ncbi:hypothetical protein SDC9_198917 [bioreactor metagenome]|uniref:Uncharacterized protein n=1 Tax=bioreactor metagenome TaxID=1076179 RepID=A0A645ISA5_9ZZZZ
MAHAVHQRKRAIGNQPDSQAVVDHAAHGVQAGDLHSLAQRLGGLAGGLTHG